MAKTTEITRQATALYNVVKHGRTDQEILALAEKVAKAKGYQAQALGAFRRCIKRHLVRRREVIAARVEQLVA